jgi:hypothetical protein
VQLKVVAAFDPSLKSLVSDTKQSRSGESQEEFPPNAFSRSKKYLVSHVQRFVPICIHSNHLG